MRVSKLRVLDLFSGIGGFSLGLERAGMETVAFCEIDPFCRKVLNKHWPGVPIHEDIKELDGEQYRESVDIVCGGFPCQDISPARGAGRLGISGEKSGLWAEMRRIISESHPAYVLVENSTELRNNGMPVVLGELAALGYVGCWHSLPASYVGSPQIRDRVWILAHATEGRERAERWPYECSQKVAEYLAHAHHDRLETTYTVWKWIIGTWGRFWGETQCPFPGVVDGIPSGLVHPCGWEPKAVAATGNAVVPQIPEILGRAILERQLK